VNAALVGAVLSFALVTASAAPVQAREAVTFNGRAEPGTIVIKTSERCLYFVLGDGRALRYKVAVGKPGRQAWTPRPRCGPTIRICPT
jgi:lipoprotein-anchoring transpeptidase ErfK/SrfK